LRNKTARISRQNSLLANPRNEQLANQAGQLYCPA
jgi:hypothetical protein